jgi:hypothetical protein
LHSEFCSAITGDLSTIPDRIAAMPNETQDQDSFLARIAEVTEADQRLLGLLVGGSHVTGTTDRFSDLDCVLVADDATYRAALDDRRNLAARFGPLLHAFTGEHVGEPRLMICLYERPILHVDIKVVTLDMLRDRVEDPKIVWTRDDRIREMLDSSMAHWPRLSPNGSRSASGFGRIMAR